MKTYTLKFAANEQDNLNIVEFESKKQIKNYRNSNLDYGKMLKSSIKDGRIESEAAIKSFADGSDHIQPYFSSLSAADETESYLNSTPLYENNEEGEKDEDTEHYLEFNEGKEEYELF